MKKFTLLALAAATVLGASAHRSYFGTDNVSGIGMASYDKTAGAVNESTGKIVVIGANVHMIDGVAPTFLEAPDGTKGVTFDGKNYQKKSPSAVTYLRFRYDGNKNAVAELRKDWYPKMDYDHFHLSVWIGPKPENATSDIITPTMIFTAYNKTLNDGATQPLTQIDFAPVTLTDEWQLVELDADRSNIVNNTYVNDDNGEEWKTNPHRYLDIRFNDIQVGQQIAVKGWGAESDWRIPQASFNKTAVHEVSLNDRNGDWNPVKPGTIFIQAEDYDPYTLNNRPTHSACMGLSQWADGYCARPNTPWCKEEDADNIRVDNFSNFTGMSLGAAWAPDNSTRKGDTSGWCLAGLSQTAPNNVGVSSYAGPYKDETSNVITLDDAMDNFGTWVEYTFNMEEDGFIDLSLRTANHNSHLIHTIWDQGKDDEHGYVTNYNKPREEGGYVVEGLDDDFLKLYGYSYALTMDEETDGKNFLRSAWAMRPGHAEKVTNPISHYANPAKWWDTTEEVDGQVVNSIFTHFYPNNNVAGVSDLWRPYYKYNHMVELYNAKDKDLVYDENGDIVLDENGNEVSQEVDCAFKKYCDKNGGLEQFLHPDYCDIPCSAGLHTIKVRFMGGVGMFDEMELTAHPTANWSGVEKVEASRVADVEEAAAVEYFDLQGRKVLNPSNGIFIVKQGSKVAKQVIR